MSNALEVDVEMYQEAVTNKCINLPIHRFLGLRLVDQTPGHATLEITPNHNHENTNGVVHGGIISSILDTVAFLAAVKTLKTGEMITTHNVYVSMLRPAPLGSKIVFTGKVIQNGKSVVFLESEAYSGGKLIANAKVTKTRTKVSKL